MTYLLPDIEVIPIQKPGALHPAKVKTENKALKWIDPPRMKKSLDASKKKLAEKTKANDDLQKLLSKTKNENAELQQKVKELEAKLAELEPEEKAEEASEEEQAA